MLQIEYFIHHFQMWTSIFSTSATSVANDVITMLFVND